MAILIGCKEEVKQEHLDKYGDAFQRCPECYQEIRSREHEIADWEKEGFIIKKNLVKKNNCGRCYMCHKYTQGAIFLQNYDNPLEVDLVWLCYDDQLEIGEME